MLNKINEGLPIKYKHLVLVFFIFLTGCINLNNTAYRTNFSEQPCQYSDTEKKTGKCPLDILSVGGNTNQEKYILGIVEFDDNGYAYHGYQKKNDDTYKNNSLELLEYFNETVKNTNKPSIVITYVHGWHHNAKQGDRDLVRFREILANMAAIYPDVQVLGLYVGWRGKVLNMPFNFLTFWNRKATAHKVGELGVGPFLFELEKIVKQNEQNKMLMIGHSFGAAVLYSGVQNILAERFIKSRSKKIVQKAEGFGDLVLLLNPAFEAKRYHSLHQLSQRDCQAYPEDQLPIFMSISSAHDKPVRYAFNAGRFLANPLKANRKHEILTCNVSQQPNYKSVTARGVNKYSFGNHSHYASHVLRILPEDHSHYSFPVISDENKNSLRASWQKLSPETPDLVVDEFLLAVDGDSDEKRKFIPFAERGESVLRNPFINIFAQDYIVKSHSDFLSSREESKEEHGLIRFIEKIMGMYFEDSTAKK